MYSDTFTANRADDGAVPLLVVIVCRVAAFNTGYLFCHGISPGYGLRRAALLSNVYHCAMFYATFCFTF